MYNQDLFSPYEELPEFDLNEIQTSKKGLTAGISILVIDDDEDQLALFAYLLKDAGYDVITATGALEGLQTLRQKKVDCIVCDVYMPWLDGRVFTHRVRTSRHLAHIPIIMLTAGSKDLEMALLASGADLFCLKREAPTRLVSQIQLLVS